MGALHHGPDTQIAVGFQRSAPRLGPNS
jgi:hypothetical protein